LRNIVYRFDDLPGFAHALRAADQELGLPPGEKVDDNEWVLAMFELGLGRGRATAAAARGLDRGGKNFVLAFERRDWERLLEFSEAKSGTMMASRPPPRGESGEVPIVAESVPASHVERTLDHDDAPTPVRGVRSPPESEPRRARSAPPKPSAKAKVAEPPTRAKSPPPSATSATSATSKLKSTGAFGSSVHARVLLCDDDRDIREVVGAMLEAVGLSVETATSAEEALERVRVLPYDLLVLDWNLPGMTGIELCRLLRREPKLVSLPVLFLTAHASSKDIVEAFASGADDYVVKPFRAPELGARIFGLLRRVRIAHSSTTL
jgi:two-component system phosphate regulon response regulator PhoB